MEGGGWGWIRDGEGMRKGGEGGRVVRTGDEDRGWFGVVDLSDQKGLSPFRVFVLFFRVCWGRGKGKWGKCSGIWGTRGASGVFLWREKAGVEV